MPKYVCDTEQVYSLGNKLTQVANDMNTQIGNYSSRIESDLAGWSGKAKTTFLSSNEQQVNTAKEDIAYLTELGEFIMNSAQEIQKLEEQLANMSI
jgi:uncharacterized protein YukE